MQKCNPFLHKEKKKKATREEKNKKSILKSYRSENKKIQCGMLSEKLQESTREMFTNNQHTIN